jgi:hypothetical protein
MRVRLTYWRASLSRRQKFWLTIFSVYSFTAHKRRAASANRANQLTLSYEDFSTGRDRPMNVSIELEDEARQTYAVFVDGVCIARFLPKAEANRVRLQALNGELGKPRLG